MFIKQANTSEEITKKKLPIKNIIASQLQNKHHFKTNSYSLHGGRLLWNVDKFLLDQITSVLYTYGFKNLKSSTCLTLSEPNM